MGAAGGGVPTNETSDGLAATSGYGTRSQQANQRMSHLQSTGRMPRSAGTTDEYGRTDYGSGGANTGLIGAGSASTGASR